MTTHMDDPCWLVVGFNARPIVESLRRYLGRKDGFIAVVDNFADIETRACSDFLFSVLRQETGKTIERTLHRSPANYLSELTEILAEEINIGSILLGSGLDDRPDLWQRLVSLGNFRGNDPHRLAFLRNREKLYAAANKIGLATPKSDIFTTLSEFETKISKYDFPCVVRREGGGGGFDVFKCNNEAKASLIARSLLDQFGKGMIMSYESGTHSSVSILGASDQTIPLSFNEQLIGRRNSFCPGEFLYCGNKIPLNMETETQDILTEQFTRLGEKLDLLGTNGIDFVLRNDEACVLELNPRFQGSLEPIELAYDLNLVRAHLQCFSDQLPEIPVRKRTAIRKILYAPRQITVPELPARLAKDRPIPGVILSKGSPMVSVVASGKTSRDAFQQLSQKEKTIWKMIGE